MRAPNARFDLLCARTGLSSAPPELWTGHAFSVRNQHTEGAERAQRGTWGDAPAFMELRRATPFLRGQEQTLTLRGVSDHPGTICTSIVLGGENMGRGSYLSFSKGNEVYIMIVPKSQRVLLLSRVQYRNAGSVT